MTDLEERYRALIRLEGPDLWDEILTRKPGPEAAGPANRGRRILAAFVAILVAGAGLPLGVRALRTISGPGPAESPTVTPPAIDARLVVTLGVGPKGQVTSVLAAAGSVWVTAYGVEVDDDQVIRRIDPSTNSIVATIPIEGVPGWEVGGGGTSFGSASLWVTGTGTTEAGRQAILQRIDPVTYQVLATIPLSGTFGADVAVNGAGVWVASFWDSAQERPAELARIDPATNEIVARITLSEGWVRRVAAVEGAVVVEEKGSVLEVIDPDVNQVRATAPSEVWGSGGQGAGGRIFALGDQVWAPSGDGFAQVDLGTAHPTGEPIGDTARPALAGSDRGIWFYDSGVLSLVDPHTDQVHAILDMPDFPARTAATIGDSIWILSWEGRIARVDVG